MRVSGIGLNAVDALYMPVDFSGDVFQKYLSRQRGAACFHVGGVLFEKQTGEKLHTMRELYSSYREQVDGQFVLPDCVF